MRWSYSVQHQCHFFQTQCILKHQSLLLDITEERMKGRPKEERCYICRQKMVMWHWSAKLKTDRDISHRRSCQKTAVQQNTGWQRGLQKWWVWWRNHKNDQQKINTACTFGDGSFIITAASVCWAAMLAPPTATEAPPTGPVIMSKMSGTNDGQ